MTGKETSLKDIELKLLEQEHRLIPAIQNFYEFRKHPENEYRSAVLKALLFRLFFSPSSVALSGLVIGLATIFVMMLSNDKIEDQNGIITAQNGLIKQQNQSILKQINYSQIDRIQLRFKDTKYAAVSRANDIKRYKSLNTELGEDTTISTINFGPSKFRDLSFVGCPYEGGIEPDYYQNATADFDNCIFTACEIHDYSEDPEDRNIPTFTNFRNCQFRRSTLDGSFNSRFDGCVFYGAQVNDLLWEINNCTMHGLIDAVHISNCDIYPALDRHGQLNLFQDCYECIFDPSEANRMSFDFNRIHLNKDSTSEEENIPIYYVIGNGLNFVNHDYKGVTFDMTCLFDELKVTLENPDDTTFIELDENILHEKKRITLRNGSKKERVVLIDYKSETNNSLEIVADESISYQLFNSDTISEPIIKEDFE